LVLLFWFFIQKSCIAVMFVGYELYLCDHMTSSWNLLISFGWTFIHIIFKYIYIS
jgi:hypothetical protein